MSRWAELDEFGNHKWQGSGATKRLRMDKRNQAVTRHRDVPWERTAQYRRIRDAFAGLHPTCEAPGFCGTIGTCMCPIPQELPAGLANAYQGASFFGEALSLEAQGGHLYAPQYGSEYEKLAG